MATRTKANAEHPLAHLIPPQKYSDEYISRQITDEHTDRDILRYAHALQSNTLLFGPTGPGKTSLVLAYAAQRRLPLVTIQCHGAIDPATFWGSREFDETTGGYVWVDSDVTKIVRLGGVIYMDEVNFLPPRVASVFHGLLDKRRQITILEHSNEQIVAHPETQIIAAYNPDYEGTKPLNPAFKNRFSVKIEMDYDAKIEAELLCIPALQVLASKLRMNQKAGDLDTPVSTNMLIEFEVHAVDLGYTFALNNFLNAFPAEERAAVREVFDLNSERIAEQLQVVKEMGEDGNDG